MTSRIYEDLPKDQGSLRWFDVLCSSEETLLFPLKKQGNWMGIKQQVLLVSEEIGWSQELQNFSKHWLTPLHWVVNLLGYKKYINMQCFVLYSSVYFWDFSHGYGLRLLCLRLWDLKFWFRVWKYHGNIDADFGMSCCTTATVLQEQVTQPLHGHVLRLAFGRVSLGPKSHHSS